MCDAHHAAVLAEPSRTNPSTRRAINRFKAIVEGPTNFLTRTTLIRIVLYFNHPAKRSQENSDAMGHETEIFSPPLPEWAICVICHDVLQDAVSMEECGHTFCKECANKCMQTRACPNCRADVTGWNPNFFARESIELMGVRCPHGKSDEGMEPSNKRRRSDGGEAVPEERCNWVGPFKDLKNHYDVCDFKIISCAVDGCNHECRRKDISTHLSFHGHIAALQKMNQMNSNQEENTNKQPDANKLAGVTNRAGSEHHERMKATRSASGKVSAISSAKAPAVLNNEALETILIMHTDTTFNLIAGSAARGEDSVPVKAMTSARNLTLAHMHAANVFLSKDVLRTKMNNAEQTAIEKYKKHQKLAKKKCIVMNDQFARAIIDLDRQDHVEIMFSHLPPESPSMKAYIESGGIKNYRRNPDIIDEEMNVKAWRGIGKAIRHSISESKVSAWRGHLA